MMMGINIWTNRNFYHPQSCNEEWVKTLDGARNCLVLLTNYFTAREAEKTAPAIRSLSGGGLFLSPFAKIQSFIP